MDLVDPIFELKKWKNNGRINKKKKKSNKSPKKALENLKKQLTTK